MARGVIRIFFVGTTPTPGRCFATCHGGAVGYERVYPVYGRVQGTQRHGCICVRANHRLARVARVLNQQQASIDSSKQVSESENSGPL